MSALMFANDVRMINKQLRLSKENFVIPGVDPSVLENLTQTDEMLIARVHPIQHMFT